MTLSLPPMPRTLHLALKGQRLVLSLEDLPDVSAEVQLPPQVVEKIRVCLILLLDQKAKASVSGRRRR